MFSLRLRPMHLPVRALFGLVLLGMTVACRADDAFSPHPLPSELARGLSEVLLKRTPQAAINVGEHRLDAHFRCQEFSEHEVALPGGKGTTQNNELSNRTFGPSNAGWSLEVSSATWSDAWRQGGDPKRTFTISSQYWRTYADAYATPDRTCVVFLRFAYGADTDLRVLEDVHSVIAKHAKRLNPTERTLPGPHHASRDVVDDPIWQILNERCPTSERRVEGDAIIYQYHVQTFSLHAVDEMGKVASEAHDEVGPSLTGFIIRISPVQTEIQSRPQSVVSLTRHLHWTHFHSERAKWKVDIYYGRMANRPLLSAVLEAFPKHRELEEFNPFAEVDHR